MDASKEEQEESKPVANPGYAHGQLQQALATSATHPDAQTRDRAAAKVGKWLKVFQGMVSGRLHIGSRNPDSTKSSWITLEVLKGGFSTGEAAAAGPLKPHEIDLLERIGKSGSPNPRLELNNFYLSDTGFPELKQMMEEGTFRIDVPEEGCFLTMAWLASKGHTALLRKLMGEIGPWLGSLRFYPVPSEKALVDSNNINRQPVSATIDDLDEVRVPVEILIEREAATVWAPLYDRLVALFADTVEGPLPELRWNAESVHKGNPSSNISGGWPCQVFPEGWQDSAKQWLNDYVALLKVHTYSSRPVNKGKDYAKLKNLLEICTSDPRKLTGKDVGLIRVIIAGAISKRGLPGSPELRAIRQVAISRSSKPTTVDIAKALRQRLNEFGECIGLDDLESLLRPVLVVGGNGDSPIEVPIPPKLEKIVKRSLCAPLEALIDEEVIVSPEMVASVLPQLTARAYCDDIPDGNLRRVVVQTYQAFRRRRSLLLLNYQHQVRLEELPWVQSVSSFREKPKSTDTALYSMLQWVTRLILERFPYTVFPNKLLQEYRQLTDSLGLQVPITEELAADIFMGDFRVKYMKAAQQAAQMLDGSLYQKYYDIPYEKIRSDEAILRLDFGVTVSPTFKRLCYERAGQPMNNKFLGVAGNGCVIEQAQVLTTHNLAPIISALGLTQEISAVATQLATTCFSWICKELRKFPYQIELCTIKNCAYAWRQMVFFLSLVPASEAQRCVAALVEELDKQNESVRKRLTPVLNGLTDVLEPARDPSGPSVRPFYGWTVSRHWIQACGSVRNPKHVK